MSNGKQSKRGTRAVTKGKKVVGFRWWSDWMSVWILGGFGLVYLVLVPLEAHPLHWLFSFLGGVAGYGIGLFSDSGLLSKVVRFVQYSLMRMILKQDRENKQKGVDR